MTTPSTGGRPSSSMVSSRASTSGYRSVGYAREVTLEWSADPDQWVTELQQPIEATGG
jgi:hypothetical protein